MSRMRQSTRAATFAPYVYDTVFLVDDTARVWPDSFAVVTACNPVLPPGSPPLTPEQGAQRAACLRGRLAQHGLPHFPVTGASRDLTHQEPGEGIVTNDLTRVAALAAEFDQWGFFWVEEGEVFVCTDSSGEGWSIGAWHERVIQQPD